MKAALFDPYLDTLGGGERYMMTAAVCLAKNGWQVDVFWDDSRIRRLITERLGIKIERVNFVPNALVNGNFFQKMKITHRYDLVFYLSDGSIPFLFGQKNFLHFQVPFQGVGGRKFLNRIKLRKIKAVVCNSLFTKRFIDREYGVKSRVLYPPVAVREFKPATKEKIILNVGRFTNLLHNKRQDVLIAGFKELIKQRPAMKDWRLVLAGSDREGKEFVDHLRELARGYPIEIQTNLHFNKLKRLYGRAKIFWVAAGFGVDENREPEKVEHFGITTVEAMAAGCVPVVINQGGQPEIVKEGQNGLLWKNQAELVSQTFKLIDNRLLWRKLSAAAQKRAQDFSEEKFCYGLQRIIS